MDLNHVRQVATDLVGERAPTLRVLGVTTAEGGSDYAEIFIAIRGCAVEPCRLTVGVDRSVSPELFRATLIDKLKQHFTDYASL